MVILVAAGAEHPRAMPIRRTPAAPVGMGAVIVKNKPAAFHLGYAKRGAAGAGHLVRCQGQVHMLGGIAV